MNPIGAIYQPDKTLFSVWAPLLNSVTLHIVSPAEERLQMLKNEQGYFTLSVNGVQPGTKYFFNPGEEHDLPDPASHYQPQGVHGPSEVVKHSDWPWTDQQWRGITFNELVLYEIHVGTFTQEGTFEAIIPRLDDLAETGINAIELMPVAQFPGERNWGYDGVYPFAVQNTYGGPTELKKLINACHEKGIAVFLDVVYNHLGPEGNYFSHYGPYFTDAYKVPWGNAMNVDGEWADGVREFMKLNITHWFEHYHIDGLRLDAIHTIIDTSATHILEELNAHARRLSEHAGRSLHMIAESDLNSPRVLYSPERGGYGFTAQWLDDFHHALYVLLDERGKERYEDFGSTAQLAKALKDGFVLSGDYVKFRKRKYGSSSAGISGDRFVVFNQNHDQIGNRPNGERLSVLTDFEGQKIAAAIMILSPYVPMFFMGEEYGDETPFYYFVSHSDPDLIEAVREGRKKDFAIGGVFDAKDAQEEKTFLDSKINWHKRKEGKHAVMLQWIKTLLLLRKTNKVFANVDKQNLQAYSPMEGCLVMHRQDEFAEKQAVCIYNLCDCEVKLSLPPSSTSWVKLIGSSDDVISDSKIISAGSEIIIPKRTAVVYGTG